LKRFKYSVILNNLRGAKKEVIFLFKRILSDIKSLKIQGAENVAKAGLKAYSLKPTKRTIKKLLKLRATEPLLENSLEYAEKHSVDETLKILKEKEEKIKNYGFKLIRSNSNVFTHCHSSTVVNILKKAKDCKKKFKVFNTETRPLYQGRKTARELAKYKIKVVSVVDSAFKVVLTKNKINLMIVGADAITKKGVYNKIGSGMFAEIAYRHKVPVYIAANSWKFDKRVEVEKRDFKEVWDTMFKNIKVQNIAFGLIERKFIKGIICEYGVLSFSGFLRKVK